LLRAEPFRRSLATKRYPGWEMDEFEVLNGCVRGMKLELGVRQERAQPLTREKP
jgi:hypothetical protein